MGGLGSGRCGFTSSPKCESQHAIDLAYLRRRGILNSGLPTTVSWSRGSERTGSITVRSLKCGVELSYRTRSHSGEWQPVDELVPFVWTPTRFGGCRQWFKCLSCGRGCRVIYGGSRFRCRRCHGLRYTSQYEPAYQRAIDQADRLRKRVGGSHGAFEGEEFPPKPKGMHWKTYRSLEERYDELQSRWTVGAMALFGFGRA